MSEQTTIEVGSEVIYRGYETDMQTVRTTVEKIDYLNGRAMATIRVGARAVLKYVTELELVAPAAPALDSQAELIAAMREAIHIFDRDGGEGQSAWNMRAVLLRALDKLESKTK